MVSATQSCLLQTLYAKSWPVLAEYKGGENWSIIAVKKIFLIDVDVSDVNFELIGYMEVYLEKLLLDRIIADFRYICQMNLRLHLCFQTSVLA